MRFRDLPTGLGQEKWQQISVGNDVSVPSIRIFAEHEIAAYEVAADHHEYEGGAFRIVQWAVRGRLRRI